MEVVGFQFDPPPRFETHYEPTGALRGWQIRDSMTGAVTHAGGEGEEEMRAMMEACALLNNLPPDGQERLVKNHTAAKLD
jgi:hypothetical protein